MMKKIELLQLREGGYKLLISLVAVIASFLVGGLFIKAMGVSPSLAYMSLVKGAFGSRLALTGTINRMIPIIFSGMAIAVGRHCGVFNIGVQGQLAAGSIAAAAAGYLVKLPLILHLPFTLLVGIVAGMGWAFLPAFLRLKKSVSIVFSTIMLNYVAQYLVDYLVIKFPDYSPTMGATPKIHSSAILPNFFKSPYRINSGIFIALGAVLLVYIYVFQTRQGFELRAVGSNPNASFSAGINVSRNAFLVMLISGALAGLAGSTEVAGMTFRVVGNATNDYMRTGIAVAMLGRLNPFAIVVAAFFFAGLKNGAGLMQMMTGVSGQFINVIQGSIIIFICCENFIRWLFAQRKARLSGDAEIL